MIKLCQHFALESQESTKISALLLSKDYKFITYAINKTIGKYPIHAEQALIAKCNKYNINMNNKTIMLNYYPPCITCALSLIEVGIKLVIYNCSDIPYRWNECYEAITLLESHGVDVINIGKVCDCSGNCYINEWDGWCWECIDCSMKYKATSKEIEIWENIN